MPKYRIEVTLDLTIRLTISAATERAALAVLDAMAPNTITEEGDILGEDVILVDVHEVRDEPHH